MHVNKYKKASSRIARRSKIKKSFSLFLKIILPITLLVGFIFLARADFLQVADFKILGAETISIESLQNTARNQISGYRFLFIPKSNIFILNKNKLAAVILADFPRIEKVEINKQFFSRKIELKVAERKGEFLWCSKNDECFSMTESGFIFEKSPNLEITELHSSYDRKNSVIFRGILEGSPLMKSFADPERMRNYLRLVEIFKGAGFEIISVNVESDDKATAKVSINGAMSEVIFNPTENDLSSVAQNVILLINEIKTKNPSVHFNYIDARFGNKIFYKLY